MQGSYNELESNKDFIGMMDNLSHEAQKKEEDIRRASEMSMRRTTITKRRVSRLSIASSTVVRLFLSLVIFNKKCRNRNVLYVILDLLALFELFALSIFVFSLSPTPEYIFILSAKIFGDFNQRGINLFV